jgi:hypothetical protein
VNGAAWNHPFAALSGLHWTSDFADRLLPIFQPSCGAVLTPAGHGQQGGQAVAIYSFRLPPGLCAGRVQAGPAWAYPGFEGKLYISMASHLVVRLEQRHTQLPGDFAETAGQDATDWAPATVAGEPWLMPARARMLVRFRGGRSVTLTASYTNYRRFESRSRVTVVGGAPK